MAEIYLYGEFNQKDIKLGIEYLTMAADTDDRICAEPCFMLSCMYGNEPERVGLPR
jgi:TPR repeat protein